MFLQGFISRLNITVITSIIDLNLILPLLISILLFVTIIYFYILEKEENMSSIYYLNLFLYVPEVLSFSKLDWLKIAGITLKFTTPRSFIEILLTGLYIIVGYLTLLFFTNFKQTMLELEIRGAKQDNVDKVFIKQSVITLILILISFLITMILAFLVTISKTLIHEILMSYGYRYIVLGILSSIIVSVSLLLYFRDTARARAITGQ